MHIEASFLRRAHGGCVAADIVGEIDDSLDGFTMVKMLCV